VTSILPSFDQRRHHSAPLPFLRLHQEEFFFVIILQVLLPALLPIQATSPWLPIPISKNQGRFDISAGSMRMARSQCPWRELNAHGAVLESTKDFNFLQLPSGTPSSTSKTVFHQERPELSFLNKMGDPRPDLILYF